MRYNGAIYPPLVILVDVVQMEVSAEKITVLPLLKRAIIKSPVILVTEGEFEQKSYNIGLNDISNPDRDHVCGLFGYGRWLGLGLPDAEFSGVQFIELSLTENGSYYPSIFRYVETGKLYSSELTCELRS